MKTKVERAALFAFLSEHPVFLRGEPFPIREGFHPGRSLYRSFAPVPTSRPFTGPSGQDPHLNRKHRQKEAPP